MTKTYSSSAYFGPNTNTAKYLQFTGPSYPNSDWTLFTICSFPRIYTGDPTAVATNHLYLWHSYATTWGGGTGGSDSFLRLGPNNFSNTSVRRKLQFRVSVGGNRPFTSNFLQSTTQFDPLTPLVICLIRSGTDMLLKVCPKGGSVVTEATETYNASFGSRAMGAICKYGGLQAGHGSMQAFGLSPEALSDADIEAIATTGEDLDSYVSSYTLLHLLDNTSSTIADLGGSATATRFGTWPTVEASPLIANASQRIECVETQPYAPRASCPFGQSNGTLELSGTYTGFTPATFQCRITDTSGTTVQEWTALTDFSAAAGEWSGSITIDAIGEYLFQVRDSSATSIQFNAAHPFRCCPVVVSTGQSPMTYFGSYYKNEVDLDGENTIVQALSIDSTNNTYIEYTPQAKSNMSSGLATMANALESIDSGMLAAYAPGDTVGTSTTNWADDEGTVWARFLAYLDASLAKHVSIYWEQGGSEGSTPAATIKANFDTIYANMQAACASRGITFRFILITYNRDTKTVDTQGIRIAQYEWWEDHADFGTTLFIGPDWTDMQMDQEDRGTAQGGTSTTIRLDANALTYAASQYATGTVVIDSGTGAGQTRTVATTNPLNPATNDLTITSPWSVNPDNTSVYRVFAQGTHPCSVQGTQRIGPRLGYHLANAHGLVSSDGKGARFVSVTYPSGGDGTTLHARVSHRNGTLLRTPNDGDSSTNVYGVEISDDDFSTTETITSVSIISANTIEIVLADTPADPTLLKFMYKRGKPVTYDNFHRLDDLLYDEADTGDDRGGLPVLFTVDPLAVTEAASGGGAVRRRGGLSGLGLRGLTGI